MSSSDHHPPPLSSAEIVQLAKECLRCIQNNVRQPALPPFLLRPSSHATLIVYLHDCAASSPNPSIAVSAYVDSLLFLSKIGDSLTSLLPSLLLTYTSLFTSRQIPHDTHSSSSLQLFSAHLNSIPTPDLVLVVDSIISYLPRISEKEDTQILILLPKSVNLIRSLEGVKNGVEYTNSVLDKLLECGWGKVLGMKMAEIIRDFVLLDKPKRSKFLAKVVGGMRDVDLQDLSCLVKHLLVLASKGFGKREVVEGIVMFFGGEEMDAKDGPMMRQVAGTVLLYMNSAVEEDPELGNEILGLAKLGCSRAFNHFSVGILLSIARVKWFNKSAIQVLKSTLFGTYKGYKFAKECKWLADDLMEDYFQHARAIEKAVLRAVKESSIGREHVGSSIVQLGFGLLEVVEKKISKEIKYELYDCITGPVDLGFEVLKSLFDHHDGVRSEIINQCCYRILSSKPEVMPIIRLLKHLVQSHPKEILDLASLLEVLLDSLTLLDSEISSSLINVLWPLMKCRRCLQDYAIMVLRKATSRPEYYVRLSSSAAIVELFLAEKQSEKDGSFSLQNSSNQACYSQNTEVGAVGVGLFQELGDLLQSCLCQQARVREIVYHGLLKLVLIDPLSTESVLNFLLPHFQRFFTKDAELLEIINCVKIENGEFFIEESIDCLLFCISWILQLFHRHATDPSVSSDIPGFSLTQENEAGRNLACLLKIKDLIKTKSLSGIFEYFKAKQTLESEKVSICYLVFLGIIEVALNNTFFDLEKATGVKVKYFVLKKEFSDLVCLYECAEEETSEHMQKRAVKRGLLRSSGNYGSEKLYSSCTNLQERSPRLKTSCLLHLLLCAVEKLELHFHDESAVLSNLHALLNDDAHNKLHRNLSFILKICMRQLDFISSLGIDDPLNIAQGNIYSFGLPLLKVILLLSGGKSDIGQRKTERKDINGHRENIQLALLCLKKVITISLCSLESLDSALAFKDLLSVAQVEIGSGNVPDPSWDNHGNVHYSAEPGRSKEMFIEKIIKPLLEEFLGLSYFHVAVIYDIVMLIANTMVGEKKNQIGEWATSICQSTSITNPEVAKCMVSLTLSLASAPNDMLVVQDMAIHLLQVVGSEKAAPSDTSEGYTVINKYTCAGISTTILEFMESIVDDMNRVIKKLRPCIASQNEARVLAMEEILCQRAEATVLVLSCFVQMNLKDPLAEQFLRIAANLYKCLARTVKLLIACKGGTQILQSTKYQKLEEITRRQLTAPLRHFVTQKTQVEFEFEFELRNQSLEGADTKGLLVDNIDGFNTESECILELILRMQGYLRELVRLRRALLRENQLEGPSTRI